MPVDTSTIVQQAITAHQLNDLYLAEKLYLSILEIDALHPDANHNLGLLYVSVDQSFEALPFLRSALETHPQIEQFWISYFEALSSAGRHGGARAILEAGKKNNLQPNVVRRLEAIVLSAENCDGIADATAKNDPPELRVEYLAQLYETGLKQPMINAAKHMLEGFPKSALLHNMIGTACLDLLQYGPARASYEAAIALDANYDLPHINLGVTLSVQGYFSEAITHYQACLKIKPDNIQALIYIGNALQSKGNFSDAADSYRRAIAVAPDCAEAHNNLGNAQENQGNREAAIKSYTQALALEPDYEEAQNNLNRVR